MNIRKSVRLLVGAATVVTSVAWLSAAEESLLLRGHITKAGFYALTEAEQRIAERGSVTGFVTEGGRTFLSAATNVTLLKGVSFGFDFRIEGAPADRPVRLTHVIKHPKMTKPDGTVLERQAFYRDVTGNEGTILGRLWYTMREDFELLPGDWTLSVLQGTSVLVEKKFTVEKQRSALLKGEVK
jgi:hypothetical protein